MRMDKNATLSAYKVVNEYEKKELVEILNDGEEYRKWIVDEIVKRRPVESTKQLAEVNVMIISGKLLGHNDKR